MQISPDETEAAETIPEPITAPNEVKEVEIVIEESNRVQEEKPLESVEIAETPQEVEVIEEVETVACFDVPLDADLQAFIIQTCEEHNIQPEIMIALIEKESTFRSDTMGDGGNSYGLCQIQPRWHKERMDKLGVTDLLDPKQNVTVAVDYLSELLARYDGDIAKALVGYNQGFYKGTITNYASTIIQRASEF